MTNLQIIVAMRKYSNAVRATEEAELELIKALEERNLYNQNSLEFLKTKCHGSLMELKAFVESELQVS